MMTDFNKSTKALAANKPSSLLLSRKAIRLQRMASLTGQSFLFLVTTLSMVAVIFILYFIFKDAIPFFTNESITDFFTTARWYPSREDAEFGALAIFFGSAIVAAGAIFVAVPIGVCAAVCLSDILPFGARQVIKPIVEILASIPSVAYGFFALVVFAPMLQNNGGTLFEVMTWMVALPILFVCMILVKDSLSDLAVLKDSNVLTVIATGLISLAGLLAIWKTGQYFSTIQIQSGTNILNVSIILGIMALPTIVSVSEDALQAIGKDLRMASYGLGATRAETIFKVVLPSAGSGIVAAILLGVMRTIGETMVVWMASGNAAQIPEPWYNLTAPVRTLTATIAGDMGEADHVTGSSRYHVLFAMALCLLVFSLVCNLISEWIVKRKQAQLKGA
jgi:phosphate transport system permease protein